MTQPSFVPVADSATVRPSMATPTPEIGRKKKAGLLGRPGGAGGAGRGTPGPDAGFALTLAALALHHVALPKGESLHDYEVGIAALASKRAALVGRGPTMSDVDVVMDVFGLRAELSDTEISDRRQRFAGLAHSYFAQRSFVDAVSDDVLRQTPGHVTDFWH